MEKETVESLIFHRRKKKKKTPPGQENPFSKKKKPKQKCKLRKADAESATMGRSKGLVMDHHWLVVQS